MQYSILEPAAYIPTETNDATAQSASGMPFQVRYHGLTRSLRREVLAHKRIIGPSFVSTATSSSTASSSPAPSAATPSSLSTSSLASPRFSVSIK